MKVSSRKSEANQAWAIKRYVPISRRKVARIGDICKGIDVEEVKYRLSLFPQRAAREVLETVKTAENSFIGKFPNSDIGSLFVKSITADKGASMKRLMYRARGSADRIQKRSCHISVVVEEKAIKVAKPVKSEKKVIEEKRDKKINKQEKE